MVLFIVQVPLSFKPRAREGRDASTHKRVHFLSGFKPRAREGRDPGARLQN